MQIKFYIYTFYKDKTIHTNGNLGAFTCFLLQIHYTYSPVASQLLAEICFELLGVELSLCKVFFSFTDYKNVKLESAAAKDLESIVSNGCYKDSFIPDMQNGIQTKSALNGLNPEEETNKMEPSLEIAHNAAHQGIVLPRPCFHLHMFFMKYILFFNPGIQRVAMVSFSCRNLKTEC